MKQKNSMKKNVMWNTFGSVFYCICQWLITIVVVRVASYETAGELSLAMTTSSSFSAISLFSMRNYQVSDVKGEYQTKEYVGSRIITCVAAFVCCGVVACFGNSLYQMLCIDAFMLIRVAEAMVDVLHGINQKYDRYDYIGKSYIFRGIVTIVVFTSGLMITENLLFTLCIMAVMNLLVAFFYDWRKTAGLERLKPVLFQSRVLMLLKNCLPIVVFTFLLSLENLIPKKVLEQQYGSADLGIYSSIASPTLVVQVFASVAFNPFLPKMSEVYYSGEIKRFRTMLHKVYLVLMGMCVVVTLGALLVGRLGLRILFGADILEYYYLFMPIVWCTICTAIIWIVSAILVALRKIKWLITGMVLDFSLCLVTVSPLVEKYGKNGVSIVQLVAMGIYILFMILICEISTYKIQRDKESER